MSVDLVSWLRAVLDERERLAVAACANEQQVRDQVWRLRDPSDPHKPGEIEDENGDVVVYDEASQPTVEAARHIAANDPATVLADIAAKRLLIDWIHETWNDATDLDFFGVDEERAYRLLASAYAHLPGYQESWRP